MVLLGLFSCVFLNMGKNTDSSVCQTENQQLSRMAHHLVV